MLSQCSADLDGAQVMGANGHQGALAAQVLVQLVLQVDEALVAGGVKGHAPQHRRHHEGAHLQEGKEGRGGTHRRARYREGVEGAAT